MSARVVLSLGGAPSPAASRLLELSPSGGLAGLRQGVTEHLGLDPEAFDICDACGKIDTDRALQRVLHVSNDVCMLEVQERPVWAKMREMNEKIEELAGAGSATDRVLAALEARMSARVDRLFNEVREQKRETASLANLTQNMALEQMSERGVRQQVESLANLVQNMALEQISERDTCNRVDAMVSFVDSMATEQRDMREMLCDLEKSSYRCMSDDLAEKVAQAQTNVEELRRFCTEKLSGQADSELERSFTDLRECAHTVQTDVQSLQKEMKSLNQWRAKLDSQEMAPSTPLTPSLRRKEKHSAGHLTAHWSDVSGPDFSPSNLPGIAYSSKSLHGTVGKFSQPGVGAAGAQFQWMSAPRQLDSLSGCRSLPSLHAAS